MKASLGDLATAAGAPVAPMDATLPLAGVGIDSRGDLQGRLFVALVGARLDGHAFVPQAIAAGAAAVAIDAAHLPAIPWQVPTLVVDDTLRALGDMAAWWRLQQRTDGVLKPVVGLTGSSGKTSTKEMLGAILLAHRPPAHRTHGNLNNLMGLPLSLFAWPQDAWAAVLEMGMNAPGEIARLTEVARPQVGLITAVHRAHLGGRGLGTVARIAAAKCELFATMPKDSVAVYNADNPPLCTAAAAVVGSRPQLRFGRGTDTDVQILAVEAAAHTQVTLRVGRNICTATLPVCGAHHADNAAAAAAAAHALGIGTTAIVRGLENLVLPPGRFAVTEVPHRQLVVIDDTYNANPDSMVAALQALLQLPVVAGGRRLAVLGDMLELGPTAPALHREVGAFAAGLDGLWTVGDHAADLAAGAAAVGLQATLCASVPALLHALQGALRAHDMVLVKASRGMRLERVVAALQAPAAEV